MKIEFRFNGTNTAILIPENGKDKQLLQLCFGEMDTIRVVPSPQSCIESIVIEASQEKCQGKYQPLKDPMRNVVNDKPYKVREAYDLDGNLIKEN